MRYVLNILIGAAVGTIAAIALFTWPAYRNFSPDTYSDYPTGTYHDDVPKGEIYDGYFAPMKDDYSFDGYDNYTYGDTPQFGEPYDNAVYGGAVQYGKPYDFTDSYYDSGHAGSDVK